MMLANRSLDIMGERASMPSQANFAGRKNQTGVDS
jgi:hypothetical protein